LCLSEKEYDADNGKSRRSHNRQNFRRVKAAQNSK